MNTTHPILEVDAVSKSYRVGKRHTAALQDINLSIESAQPEIVTIAGESGSGKSTLATLVLGFESPTSGIIRVDGEDLSKKNAAAWKSYRQQVQAVFQDPFGVFNPFYRVQHVFDVVFRNFRTDYPASNRESQVADALSSVGLSGEDILSKYPHQLSGGQRQRIMMARACLMKPRLIVADEPVSMVDASLRAAILEVMMRLRDEHGISFIYITHDLATAYQVSDRILLLYQGRVVEEGRSTDVIGSPRHPYARLLVGSIPGIEYSRQWIESPVSAVDESNRRPDYSGCRFHPRCEWAKERCHRATPLLERVEGSQRKVACHYLPESPP